MSTEPAVALLLVMLIVLGVAGAAGLQTAGEHQRGAAGERVLAASHDQLALLLQQAEVSRHEVLTGDARGDRLTTDLALAGQALDVVATQAAEEHHEDIRALTSGFGLYRAMAADPARDVGADRSFDELIERVGAESAGHRQAATREEVVAQQRLGLLQLGLGALVLVAMTVGLLAAASLVAGRRSLEEYAAERTADSRRDALTGLPNRTAMVERVTAELAEAGCTGGDLAVLWVDLDGFKAANDLLGHRTGDELLRQVAERLRIAVRPEDLVARFGGDEFVVLCPALPARPEAAAGQIAQDVARRLVAALRLPFVTDSGDHLLSASVGVALRPAADADGLLSAADTAMYRAKAAGRDQFAVFDESTRVLETTRQQLTQELAVAADAGELRLHYQPMVGLEDGCAVGVEALVRWQHPQRGLLPPSEFLSLAEETGHVVRIGTWVLAEACRTLADWQREAGPGGHAPRMSVNLSARQLAVPNLVETVRACLQESGADAVGLCLEVTESMVMDVSTAVPVLEGLRRLGVKLSLDDFGTGYSSLSYLKDLPVHQVKIDRSFVRELGQDARNSPIVAAVVRLCEAVGLDLVAEGVETERQRRLLLGLGCRVGQGYLWSTPLPRPEVERWLGERAAILRPTG